MVMKQFIRQDGKKGKKNPKAALGVVVRVIFTIVLRPVYVL